MSHTFRGKSGTYFYFNSDFSGDVRVTVKGQSLEIPGKDILEFVAFNYVLNERITKLEDMKFEDLLK